jgi:toluene monooxygenase electron transfer component
VPAWPEGLPLPDHYQGRVAFRQVLTRDVAAVTVALDRPMRFQSGQFAVLRSRTIPGYRAYSMVEGDGASANLIFVVKRKPNGMASPWLVDGIGEQTPLEVFGPLGRVVLRPQEEAHLLVAAGGTGIAGLLAILRQAAARGHFERFRADIVFGVRMLTDAFLLGSLSELASRWPDRVQVVVAVSDEPLNRDVHPVYPAIRLAEGTVDAVLARTNEGPRENTIAFVGGPPPMVDASIRVLLKTVRLPPSAIRFDRFW